MTRGAEGDVALLEGMLEEWGRGEFWNPEPSTCS